MTQVSRHYADQAHQLRSRYESVVFEDIHHGLLPFLPPSPAAVADIGAGSGRDARALAALGYDVLAVEPSAAMRRHAGIKGSGKGVVWLDDKLPSLPYAKALGRRFDFILCSAVLMHLPARDLTDAFKSLGAILAEDGRLAISLRPALPGDPEGLIQDHAMDFILLSAAAAGLRMIAQGRDADRMDRPADWHWSVFVQSDTPS